MLRCTTGTLLLTLRRQHALAAHQKISRFPITVSLSTFFAGNNDEYAGT